MLLLIDSENVVCREANSCGDGGTYTCSNSPGEIECSGEASCIGSTFVCDGDCTLFCQAHESCSGSSTFDFENEGSDVKVNCMGSDSCMFATFELTDDDMHTDFVCNGTYSCNQIHIFIDSKSSTFSIDCGGTQSCKDIQCNCADADKCLTAATPNINCTTFP